MSNAALLASRYARRPLLIEPNAARELLRHIAASDPRGMQRESRLEAALRVIGLGRGRPAAQDAFDDAAEDRAASAAGPLRPGAYTPLWAQQAYGEPIDEGFGWALFEGVACMEVATAISDRGEYYCGTWFHGYDTILAAQREALADSRVKALWIRMFSPGGVVAGGLYELSAFMRGARAAAGGKPIHVFADMACSAAYWIAGQADRVTAPKVGLVGSIGAVLIHEDWSGADAKAGVVVTPIQFGAEKTAGASWAPLSASARADLQAEIDQCGRDFVGEVVAGRPKLTSEALIDTEARVFMADHADPARSGLEIGFIDAIASEQESFAELLAHVAGASPRSSHAQPRKEASMANPNRHARRAAAAKAASAPPAAVRPAAAAAAPVQPAAAAPDPGYVDCETCNGTGMMADDTPCADCDGEGQVPANPDPDEEPDDLENTAAANALAIAASAELNTHPHLAAAAMRSGQTLAQLQATIAALAAAPKGSRLDGAMAQAARLGPDATAKTATPTLDAADIYAKRREAVARRPGR